MSNEPGEERKEMNNSEFKHKLKWEVGWKMRKK